LDDDQNVGLHHPNQKNYQLLVDGIAFITDNLLSLEDIVCSFNGVSGTDCGTFSCRGDLSLLDPVNGLCVRSCFDGMIKIWVGIKTCEG
jgi:hypothetical protein